MGEALRKRLLQTRFENPTEEALLNVMVAAAHLRGRLEQRCAELGISQRQYNVLRALRGVHPDGYARCDIGRRLIERAPDVTRLIDRLEKQGLVERIASERDRRLSVTRITRKGLRLLEDFQPVLDELLRDVSSRLPARDARELSRLCEAIYSNEEVES